MLASSPFGIIRNAIVVSAFGAGLVLALSARPASAQSERGTPPPLPEEAFTACTSKAEGDACSVTFHDHTVNGTCAKHPSDARLFCRLSAPPGPPPEAFQACEGKKAADECSIQLAGHSMLGNCIEGHEGKLVCAPSRPPSAEPPR